MQYKGKQDKWMYIPLYIFFKMAKYFHDWKMIRKAICKQSFFFSPPLHTHTHERANKNTVKTFTLNFCNSLLCLKIYEKEKSIKKKKYTFHLFGKH